MAQKDNIGRFVSSIVELFTRVVKPSGDNSIYNNDSDNLYPNRIEIIERNSPTASACSNKLKAFIMGQGFADESVGDTVVNKHKGLTLNDIKNLIAHSVKTHRGACLHINYDIEGAINYLDVLPYKKCRISKEDTFGNQGKVYFRDWDVQKRIGQSIGERWFYPYNGDLSAVNEQRRNDAKVGGYKDADAETILRNYRGQVLFLSLDDTEVYPYAWLNPAYNDADSEFRLGVYRNNNLRSGFLDKVMIIPNGLDEESQAEFNDAVKEWLGAENAATAFVFNPPAGQLIDLNNTIRTIELKGTYDSKRFEQDERAYSNNIRKAYLSIPNILIEPSDSFFGSSGEAFREAVAHYNDETQHIRDAITGVFERIFGDDRDYTIKPLGNDG